MTIRLKNVTIDKCGVGISAPADARIEADGLVITNTGRAIELRNPATFLGALGLPEDTPRELVIDLLRQFRDKPATSSSDAAGRVRESELLKWLGATADVTGIGGALFSLQEGGFINKVIERVFG